jgi:peroxiredoxin
MIRNRIFPLLAVAAFVSFTATACTQSESQAAPVLDNPPVNQPAPAFTVTDTRGKTHSLDSYRGKWVVLEWFNHDCPYTKKHYKTDNMQALQREYTAKGVVWISVVSSAPGKDGYLTAANADKAMADNKAAPSFVVRDTAGVLGRMYGARNTPQLFAIDPEGVLRYAGAIDDKPSPRQKDVKDAKNYVRAALDAGLAGQPIAITTTQPYGCDVKY